MIIWSGILCLHYRCDRNKFIPSLFACVPLISPLNFVFIYKFLYSYIHTYMCCGAAAKLDPRASHSWDFAITMRHTLNWIHTRGRTSLNEWSARWKVNACKTHSTTTETNIHAFSGIQTHDCSNRAAADVCLRPHGHRDWQTVCSLFKCWLTPRSRNLPLNPELSSLWRYSVIVVKACLLMLYGVPNETPA